MGIGPQEFRHRGLFHDNYFVRFVRRTSVMSERGDTNCWKNTKQGQKHEERAFQSVRSELESFAGAALLAYRSKFVGFHFPDYDCNDFLTALSCLPRVGYPSESCHR